MERLHAPSEVLLEGLDATFRSAPHPGRVRAAGGALARSRPHLRRAGVESRRQNTRSLISPGLGRLRELVAAATRLLAAARDRKRIEGVPRNRHWRQRLRDRRAVPGPDGRPLPFHITVRAPQAAAVHRALIERIVELEKPGIRDT